MRGDFSPSDSAHSRLHLWEFHHHPLRLLLQLDGLGQGHARESHDLGRQRPLLQDRDKFPPHERDKGKTEQYDRHRTGQHEAPVSESPLQHRQIPLLHPERQMRVLRMVSAQDQGREYRGQGQRHHDRGQERDHQRVGQRREHLPFHPFQRHERQEDDADD